MPSSSDLFVERLADGSRRVEFQTDVPEGFEVVLAPGEDHLHVVYGSVEDLVAAGLRQPEAEPKPAPAKKPAAKKPAARKAKA